ncbi:hypothetical protein [Marinicellulosiphila megalodicopiae]|uniref:hypothetical protein n=1 Tax=Marinicellulosiphila megalodicopiae TaxID=2724896 RepID=UPI003BB0A6E5
MTDLVFNEAESIALLKFHLKKQDLESALSLGKRAVISFPENNIIRFILASVQSDIGLYEQAQKDYLHCLDADPEFHLARFQLALMYWNHSHQTQSVDEFQQIANSEQETFLNHFSRGFIQLSENNLSEAKTHFQTGMTNNLLLPDLNTDIQKLINNLETNKTDNNVESEMSDNAASESITPAHLSKYFS